MEFVKKKHETTDIDSLPCTPSGKKGKSLLGIVRQMLIECGLELEMSASLNE